MPKIPVENPFLDGVLNPKSTDLLTLPEDTEPDPSLGQLAGAAFRVENSAVSDYVNAYPTHGTQEGYDVFDDIEGYEIYANSFLDVESPEDAARVKANIDRELEDRALLANGGVPGFLFQLGAGILDPIYLPLMAIPGSKIVQQGGRSAGRIAALSAASEALAEVAKHQSQETRTGLESAINVAGATVLAGVTGLGLDYAMSKEGKRLADQINKDMVEPNFSVGSAEVVKNSMEDLELVNAGKLEQWGVSPQVRLATSESVAARRAASEIMEMPLVTKGNVKGKVTQPTLGTLETRTKRLQDAPMASFIEQTDDLYKAYRTRIKGTGEAKITRRQFLEQTGRAARRKDMHNIPEVAKAAAILRKDVFDPPLNRAIQAGLLEEGVTVTTAPSYFRRLYKHEAIIQKRQQWNDTVEGWLARVEPNLSPPEVQAIQREITDNILGTGFGRLNYEAIPLTRGPLKERVFDIPDELIEDFLEDNAGIVARDYLRTMVPDTELADAYGDTAMTTVFDDIRRDYANLIDEAKTAKEQKHLNKLLERDIRDLEVVRDRLRGLYLGGGDPGGWGVRTLRFIRDLNFLRMLGGMTLSAIPDLARPVAVNGLKPVAKGLVAIASMPKKLRMTMKQAKKFGIGLDMVLNSRAASLSAVDDVFARSTKIERGMKHLSNQFSKVSLMAPWNAALKQWVSVVNADRLLTESLNWAGGKISKAARTRMAQSGISEDMAKRIASQFQEFGDGESVLKLAQVQFWTDGEAAEVFTNAILKDVDRTIVTPGIGELPVWTDAELGKQVFQFKTFAAASHHKIMLSDLQYRDANALNGFLLATALGTAAYASKMYVAGREISDDPEKLIVEALDRSGVFGYMWDINNTMEKMTAGAIGVNRLIGESPMSRYISRNGVGALLGPSFGTAEDIRRLASDFGAAEVDEGTIRTMRKLLPYQNLFYVRRLLNSLEEGVAETIE